MKVPINQKFMLTITEASEYFGIGEKVLRKFAVDHQEISIRYGNRWRIIREKMEDIPSRFRRRVRFVMSRCSTRCSKTNTTPWSLPSKEATISS